MILAIVTLAPLLSLQTALSSLLLLFCSSFSFLTLNEPELLLLSATRQSLQKNFATLPSPWPANLQCYESYWRERSCR